MTIDDPRVDALMLVLERLTKGMHSRMELRSIALAMLNIIIPNGR